MEPLTLKIEGMHCGACVNRVTRALQKLEGVQVLDVQIGSAKLAGDAALAAEALTKAGYPAQVA